MVGTAYSVSFHRLEFELQDVCVCVSYETHIFVIHGEPSALL